MAINTLAFTLPDGRVISAAVNRLLGAGMTNREQSLIDAHIAELAEQNIPPPPHIPFLFPAMPTLATNASELAVLGELTTPELEFALFRSQGVDYVTVASDQTDRVLEQTHLLVSKNACPKILGAQAWPVDEVADHWDAIQMRSTSEEVLLQEGNFAQFIAHADMLALAAQYDGSEHEGRIVMSGTVPTLALPRKGEVTVVLELIDPVLDRTLRHAYTVHPMSPIFE